MIFTPQLHVSFVSDSVLWCVLSSIFFSFSLLLEPAVVSDVFHSSSSESVSILVKHIVRY